MPSNLIAATAASGDTHMTQERPSAPVTPMPHTQHAPLNWGLSDALVGTRIVLQPLSLEHATTLKEAVADGDLWALWYTKIPTVNDMEAEIARRLELQSRGVMMPFTVEDRATKKVLGMTTFMNIDQSNRRLEIGSTWYRASAQRTSVNTECKLLLLTYAFDTLACIAVEFRTSSFNIKSRTAIERIGAKLDGVLRNHQIVEGNVLRDTYVYSITSSEWPAVRKNLNWKRQDSYRHT